MKSEEVRCDYCEKILSEEKGEVAHGCLECHGMPYTYRIINLEQKLQEKEKLLDEALKELEWFTNKYAPVDHCYKLNAKKFLKKVKQ